MKKLLLSIMSLATIGSQAQVLKDYAVSASLTTVNAGQKSLITVSNSQQGVLYSLRNSANVLVGNAQAGNGNSLDFSTDPISTTETFNVYAESVNSIGLEFTDYSQNFTASVPTGLDYSTSYTFEGWVKRETSSSAYTTIFAIENVTSSDIEIYSGNTDIAIVHNRGNGGTVGALYISGVPSIGIWYHLSVVFDGTHLRVAYNGISQGSNVITAPIMTANARMIVGSFTNSSWTGAAAGQPTGLIGQLDDIRLWSTARTPTEIVYNMKQCLAGTETGLEALYKCNSTSGATVLDEVASNHGTLNNYTTVSDAWRIMNGANVPCNGGIGGTIEFTEYNQNVHADVPSGLNYNTGYTIEGWVKAPLSGSGYYSTILTIENATSSDIEIMIPKGADLLTVLHNRGNTGPIAMKQFTTPPDNVWYHLAVVFDGTNIEVFYDGVSQGAAIPMGAPVMSANTTISIGSFTNSSWEGAVTGFTHGYIGQLDELRIWNGARTSANIKDNMYSCMGNAPTELKAYYKFDEKNETTALNEIGNINATLQNMDHNVWKADNDAFSHCTSISGFSMNMQMSQTATVTVGSVGINEVTQNIDFIVYPNPTTGKVTFSTTGISTSLDYRIKSIELYNLTGQKVGQFQNTSTIDISSLPNGIYAAKIIVGSSKPTMHKLVKE